MNRKRRPFSVCILLSILLLLSISPGAHAAEPLVLRDGVAYYPLGGHLEILEDKSGLLTINDVLSPDVKKKFVRDGRETPSFGLADSVFWLRFRVSDRSLNTDGWLLEENFPHIDNFDLYVPRSDGSFVVKKARMTEPFAGREVPHRNPVFLLPVTREERTFYLRAASQGTLVFPLTILSRNELFKQDTVRLLGFGLYFGVMLAMALYNLYLSIFLRDRIYLYYVFYVFSFAMVQASAHGFVRQFLLPASPVADYYFMRFLILLTCLTSMIFSRSFLKPGQYAPGLDKLLKFLIAADVALMPFMFIFPGIVYLIILDVNTALTVVLSAATGLACYLRGYKPARYYLMARACHYASILAFVIWNTVLRQHNFLTWYGMLVGSVIDVLLLSLALADRVSVMREQKLKAEAEAGRAAGRALIGDMAAGVAHEVNNPLAGVILCFQGLKNAREDDTNRPELVAAIETGLVKIKETVAQLLNFSRLSNAEMKPADLNGVIRNVLSLCKYRLDKENIIVDAELAPDLPRLLLDETRMGQVIANVVLNAAHAMRGGGTLTIQTRRKGDWCVLSLADTGPGIPPEVLPRIFEPFFTTKPVGEGTGLGLSLSKNIVDAHHGSMDMESFFGEGTTCTIKLPMERTGYLA